MKALSTEHIPIGLSIGLLLVGHLLPITAAAQYASPPEQQYFDGPQAWKLDARAARAFQANDTTGRGQPFPETHGVSVSDRADRSIQRPATQRDDDDRIGRLEREVAVLHDFVRNHAPDRDQAGHFDVWQTGYQADVHALDTSSRLANSAAAATTSPASDDDCEICLPVDWQHRLANLLCKPQYPTHELGGFLQLDIGWVSQDEANRATVGDVHNAAGLRRVRLHVKGDINAFTNYVVDLDFAGDGHPSFRDVMITFRQLGLLQQNHFGYFKQPFGLSAMSSNREMLFLERPLNFAFDPFRQLGIGTHNVLDDDRGTAALSVYRFPTDNFANNNGDNGGWAAAGRITYLPVFEDNGDVLVHTGIGYSFGDPGDDVVRYAIQPGFFVSDDPTSPGRTSVPVFVDTGRIPTENFNLAALELGGAAGPLTLQSEVTTSLVHQTNGPFLNFWAAYVWLGYVLTGDRRTYHLDRGVFGAVDPVNDFEWGCGGGSWELALGWSYIDLNDRNIAGGDLQSLAVGLNWRLNPSVVVKFNVIRALMDDPTIGTSAATLAGMRLQASF